MFSIAKNRNPAYNANRCLQFTHSEVHSSKCCLGQSEISKIGANSWLLLYARLQTGRIMVWWCPSVRLSVRPSGSPSTCFPHFFHTCFDILSWNFAHHFVLLYYRSSSSVVTLRQFLKELCLFWNLEYWKYTFFRTFLLHALTYRAEI